MTAKLAEVLRHLEALGARTAPDFDNDDVTYEHWVRASAQAALALLLDDAAGGREIFRPVADVLRDAGASRR